MSNPNFTTLEFIEDFIFVALLFYSSNTDEVKPDYFMTVNEACIQVLKFIEMAKCEGKNIFGLNEDTKCIGIARVGLKTQKLVYKPLKDLVHIDFGPPMHSLIIPAEVDDLIEEGVEILCQS